MFIRSVNNGGYRGDVNTAFRQGRQDAFRDYIDNFNFALQADSANNRENQVAVERIVGNQNRMYDMNQRTRQEALDFAKANVEIPSKVYEAELNFNRLGNLYPNVEQLGQAKADEERALQFDKTNKAKSSMELSANKQDNIDFYKQQDNTQAQAQVAKNTNSLTTEQYKAKGLQLTEKLANFGSVKNTQQREIDYLKRAAAEARVLNPERFENMSDADMFAMIKRSPKYNDEVNAYHQQQYGILKAEQDALNSKASQTWDNSPQAKPATTRSSTTKPLQPKPGKVSTLTEDKLEAQLKGRKAIGTYNGNTVYSRGDGSLLVVSEDGTAGTYYDITMLDGGDGVYKKANDQQALEFFGISLDQAPHKIDEVDSTDDEGNTSYKYIIGPRGVPVRVPVSEQDKQQTQFVARTFSGL